MRLRRRIRERGSAERARPVRSRPRIAAGVPAGLAALALRAVPAALVAGTFGFVPAPPAHAAHAALKSISPADGATVTEAPAAAVLTFNERVDARFTTVRVSGPGRTTVSAGDDRVSGVVVTQPLRPLTVPGRYTVSFRTVSADGHPIEGRRGFDFAPAPGSGAGSAASTTPTAGTAAVLPPEAGVPPRPTEQPSDTSPLMLGGAGAVLASALGAAVLLTVRRRRHDH